MRLIDADALKEEVIKAQNREDTNSYINMGLARAVELIANAPTVDTTFREVVAYECGQKSVEERHKGEWERIDGYGGLYICTNCGENTTETVMGKPRFNFCPNCGRRMKK